MINICSSSESNNTSFADVEFHKCSYSEKPNKMQQCIKILLFLILNEAQHGSGDTLPIIRSLKLHQQPLVSH